MGRAFEQSPLQSTGHTRLVRGSTPAGARQIFLTELGWSTALQQLRDQEIAESQARLTEQHRAAQERRVIIDRNLHLAVPTLGELSRARRDVELDAAQGS